MSFIDRAVGSIKGRSNDEEDIFGGGPPPAAGSTKTPIGVPEDYTALVPPDPRSSNIASGYGYELGPSKVNPRYFDGDEYKPAQLNPASIAELQRQMVEVGLLGNTFRLGVWDSASVAAYRDLLSFANGSGLSDRQALLRYSAGEQVGTESQRAPLIVQKSNPEELRRVFRQAVIDQLGQGWDQNRINGLVTAYQAEEERVQRQAYDMELTGGSITNIPSPEAFIESKVMEQDPGGVQVRDTLDFVSQFKQIASSPGWAGG
jgi:hypothetical protein